MSANQVQAAFSQQAQQCAALGSPFMERLLNLFVAHWHAHGPVMEALRHWPGGDAANSGTGDASGKADSLPLRMASGLHALVLLDRNAALKAAYPPHDPGDAALWRAIRQVLWSQSDFLLNWIKSPPQTNEIRRSAALIPAAAMLSRQFNMPLTLSELGASGGLNLNFDRFALQAGPHLLGAADPVLTLSPDWTGTPPQQAEITVNARRGVDLNPLTGPGDTLRLRAYLWADQRHRMTLTEAGLACPTPQVDAGDVAPWLEHRLSQDTKGTAHLVYHTVAWQYFNVETKARCTKLLAQAGARATPDAPLAWLGMEADGTSQNGAALTLRLWPGNTTLSLGRADFHGRWINWDPKEQTT